MTDDYLKPTIEAVERYWKSVVADINFRRIPVSQTMKREMERAFKADMQRAIEKNTAG